MAQYTLLSAAVAIALLFAQFGSAASAEIWKNETALFDLIYDWQASGTPAEHQLVHEVRDFHNNDKSNGFANNLMGVLSHTNKDLVTAAYYFKAACHSTDFQSVEFVTNFVRTQNAIDGRVTLNVLTPALQKDIYNEHVLNEVITLLQAICQQSQQPVDEALAVIDKVPTIHRLWVIFAEFALKTSNSPGFDAVSVTALTTYGLTIFPRSCELLLLRATLYLRKGDVQCAGQLYRSAEKVKRLFTNSFDATAYFNLLATRTSFSTDSKQCMPVLHGHTSAQYQELYHFITDVTGDYWTHLYEHHTMPASHKAQPALINSVFTATELQPDGTTTTVHLPSLQIGCSDHTKCAKPGFLVVDALEAISTHYVTMAYDLHMIESGSVGVVYSSHTLEHLSYNNPPVTCASFPVSYRNGEDRGCYSELDAALAEWRRVLAPGGTLLVSVPDVVVLAKNFIDPSTSTTTRLFLRSMLFGGQNTQHDFHKNALYLEYLQALLETHGFCNIKQVKEFGLFMDFSGITFESGEAFSLNVRATAC